MNHQYHHAKLGLSGSDSRLAKFFPYGRSFFAFLNRYKNKSKTETGKAVKKSTITHSQISFGARDTYEHIDSAKTGNTPPKKHLKRFFLIVMFVAVVFLIMLVKSKTITEFNIHPLLFAYSICITTFFLFRILGALYYNASFKRVVSPDDRYVCEPTISFVIPCKNEEKNIAETISKCFQAKYPREKIEVVVVNDGSTDNTMRVLEGIRKKYRNFKIINWENNRGKRQAMVAGFKKSSGDIIIQLDSDSYIYPESVVEIVKPFGHAEIGAVCAHADPKNTNDNFITKMQAAYYFVSFRIFKAMESSLFSVFCCSGCSSAYRREVVLPILDKWRNEKFLGLPVTWGDDRSLTTWVLKQGYKTIYTDRAKACTIVPNDFKTLMKQQLRWKKSWIVNSIITGRFLIRKHPFIALIYYFPLVIISFFNPVVLFFAFIYPIIFGITPVFYILGVLLVTTLLAIFYKSINNNDNYWIYLYPWSILTVFILTPMMAYAFLRIQDRDWGTR